MRLKEAYSILEIPEDTPLNEAKKKYRELSKKYHPDINKDPDADDRFKKINEAYARIQKGEDDEIDFSGSRGNPFDPFSGFNPFGKSRQQPQVSNILINTNISFAESVFGVKKELKFKRKTKCGSCNGQGETTADNGCSLCKGLGQITNRQGNMVFVQTCSKCYGKVKTIPCHACKTSGVLDSDITINVTIPGGIVDGNILRLSGMGNFAGQFMSMDQHSDVHLHVKVENDPDFMLDNGSVISKLEISLLEAIRGCNKTVKTVLGTKDINIKPLSKNNDIISIPNMGVNRIGDQKVIINVEYPKDTTTLIDALMQSEDK